MPNGGSEYRELWEMVRDNQKELKRMQEYAFKLEHTIDEKNEEIKALQIAIRSLRNE